MLHSNGPIKGTVLGQEKPAFPCSRMEGPRCCTLMVRSKALFSGKKSPPFLEVLLPLNTRGR